jgi:hypothetical protein
MNSVVSCSSVALIVWWCASTLSIAEALDDHAVKEHYTGSFIQFPESIEYDPLHDVYFIHKGKLPNAPVTMQTAWISVMSPNGNVIREDFGQCPLAKYPEPYANLGAMTVRNPSPNEVFTQTPVKNTLHLPYVISEVIPLYATFFTSALLL